MTNLQRSLEQSEPTLAAGNPDGNALLDEARAQAYRPSLKLAANTAQMEQHNHASDQAQEQKPEQKTEQQFKAADARLPEIDSAKVKDVHWSSKENVVEIAPGVKFNSWNFGGTVPGPVLAVNQGDEIRFQIKNEGDMPHSIDFHAAKTPPDKSYRTIDPGDTHSFTWKADYPGAFLYHCGTPMALHHMAMGMYGAVIVKPKDLPKADKEFVLVQSEFYTTKPDKKGEAAYTDIDKALEGKPDYVTFNGYSNQYMDEPLKVKVGDKVRMWVVNAGPSHESAFHVVGTIFDAVYPDGNPKNKMEGMQTISIPPGGGAMVEFTLNEPGKYPFVTHAFGDASKGAVGVIEATP